VKDHFAGSISFDNDDGEWQDHVITRPEYKDLITDMKQFMRKRRNSEVFFAVVVRDGKEIDITERVRVACR
jgi:hypothetical protein